MFLKLLAERSYAFPLTDAEKSALFAARSPRLTDISAVKDEPVVGRWDDIGRDVANKFLFHAERRGALFGNEPYAVADTKDVCIHSHACFLENDGLNDVGRLAAHAGKALELLARRGYFSAKLAEKHLRHAHEMARLGVGITDTANVFVDDFGRGTGHCFGRGVVPEEARRYEVNALVRTLCAENDGNEQLKRIFVVQFCLSHGHRLPEVLNDFFVEFFLFHRHRPEKCLSSEASMGD